MNTEGHGNLDDGETKEPGINSGAPNCLVVDENKVLKNESTVVQLCLAPNSDDKVFVAIGGDEK